MCARSGGNSACGMCSKDRCAKLEAGCALRQLVDTTTGNHIWADRYEGALEDVFDLQDRVTSSVVAVIEPKVRLAEIARAQAKPTENLTGLRSLFCARLPSTTTMKRN